MIDETASCSIAPLQFNQYNQHFLAALFKARVPTWDQPFFFLFCFFFPRLECRFYILVAHSSHLSLLRKSHIASFQVHVACRFYPWEGLVSVLKPTQRAHLVVWTRKISQYTKRMSAKIKMTIITLQRNEWRNSKID